MSATTAALELPGRSRSVLGLIGWLAVCFAAATFGALFMPGAWYAQLQKPSWTPPNWLFAPVWSLLYVLMAVAAWLVWKRGGFAVQRGALGLFLLQLLCNALWSPLVFGLHHLLFGFVDICLLWLALLGTVIAFWRVRPVAGGLLLPYLIWVSFAAGLNLALWRLNA